MWNSARFATPALAVLFLATQPSSAGAQQDGQYRAMRPGVTVDLSVQHSDPADAAMAGTVDTTLLRAYASRFDYHRVDEEIRRLGEMHPGWTPPTDLFAPKAATVDERGLWSGWERGDLAAVDREIAILRSLNPGWTPPQKLIELVETRRMRDAVEAAAAGSDWDGIIKLAAGQPSLFTCAQVENLWDLAQAQFRSGDRAAAYATYGTAMATCKSADLRLATLQKALANRDSAALKSLIEREAGQTRTAEQDARFAAIQKDFGGSDKENTRVATAAVAAAPDKLGEALGRLAKGRSDAAELGWIQIAARDKRDARAAQGLGWYYFNAGNWNEAGTWFKFAMDWKPSAKTAEGLVYSWQKLGREDEARALAATWAGKAPKLKEVLKAGSRAGGVAVAFEKGDFTAVLALTEPGRGPEAEAGLALRGWTLLKLNRPAEAGRAFEAALKGAGSDKAKAADAAQGLALANNAQGLSREARAVIEAHAVAPEKSVTLNADILVQDALAAFNRGSFSEALRLIAQVKRLAPENQSLAMVEAWSLYKSNQFAEAQMAFKRLTDVYGSAEARDGLRLATAQVDRRWE